MLFIFPWSGVLSLTSYSSPRNQSKAFQFFDSQSPRLSWDILRELRSFSPEEDNNQIKQSQPTSPQLAATGPS